MEHPPGMLPEPHRWLPWVEWVDMRMRKAHVGQRRGRIIWMLVTDCITLSGSLSCPGARQAGGVPKSSLMLLNSFYTSVV